MPHPSLTKAIRNHIKTTDWIFYLLVAQIVAFCFTLWTAFLFPIYPDEIVVRSMQSRLVYDYPYKISGTPTCLSSFYQSIPLSAYIPGFVEWLIHGTIATPFWLRAVGIIIFLSWLGLLLLYRPPSSLLYPLNRRDRLVEEATRAVFLLSLLSLGVLPIFLVINRGEQLILASIVILLSLAFSNDHFRLQNSAIKKLVAFALYTFAASMALYSHPKSLFLTPVFIAIAWQTFGGIKQWRFLLAALGVLTSLSYQSHSYWTSLYSCPESPAIEGILKSFSFDPLLLLYDPSAFFRLSLQSLKNFDKYLIKLSFQEMTDIGYLPKIQIGATTRLANFFICFNIISIFLYVSSNLLFNFSKLFFVRDKNAPYILILLLLLICVLISGIFNLPKAWYDAGYMYSMLAIIIFFFLSKIKPDFLQSCRGILAYLAFVSIFSQLIFTMKYLPHFKSGFSGPGVSLISYDVDAIHNTIASLVPKCGIDIHKNRNLIIDDLTYFELKNNKWPMPITYMFYGNDKEAIIRFISSVKLGGVVTRCDYIQSFVEFLSPEFEPYIKRQNNLCCIDKDDLKKIYHQN